MSGAVAALELAADRFVAVALARGFDGLLALALVGAAWAFARRRASSHFRALLPWLALLPLLLPLGAKLPAPLRALGWRNAFAAADPSSRGDATPAAAPVDGAARAMAASELDALLAAVLHGDGAGRRNGDAPATERATDRESSEGASAAAAGQKSVGSPSWRLVAFAAWLAVVTTALLLWAARSLRWRRTFAAARPLPLRELPSAARAVARIAAARGIALLASDTLPAPLAVGLFRPAIVVPRALLAALDGGQLRFVLLHELAHLRRGDLWAALLLRVVRVAWFFHPAPWIAGRLLLREREHACDDAALARFAPPERARCAEGFLKVVEESRRGAAELAGVATLANEVTDVRSRIMRMVETRRFVQRALSRGDAFAAAALAVALLLAEQPARSQQVPPPAQPPAAPAAPQQAKGDSPDAAAGATTRAAVTAAADWLLRHQEETGGWDSDGFGARCKECDGKGQALNDVGVTGLATLALIRAGKLGEARADDALAKASRYLVSIQDGESGCLGAKAGQHFMYGHMIGSLALGELQGRASDAERGKALEKAVAFIVRSRNPYKGWRYSSPPDGDNDSSVTCFALLALESARKAGIGVDQAALDDGFKFLASMQDPASGRVGYMTTGSPSAREREDMERFPAEKVEALTAAALHARVAQGDRFDQDAAMRSGLERVSRTPPQWDPKAGSIDFYYWWHGTVALRAAGGPAWESWRKAVEAALLGRQAAEGHPRGSFEPSTDPWCDNGGRVYATAINLMTLAETLAP